MQLQLKPAPDGTLNDTIEGVCNESIEILCAEVRETVIRERVNRR